MTPSDTPGPSSPKIEDEDEEMASGSEGESDDGKTWCICNGPDDGRKMINCDGCENWFHLKCLKIPDQVGDLIKDFFCPACTTETHRTKYNPHCSSKPCMKPARIELYPKGEWKYCSDDHGRRFAREAMKRLRAEGGATRGGVISGPELRNMLESVSTEEEWKRLGEKPGLDANKMRELRKKSEASVGGMAQVENISAIASPMPILPGQETPIETVEITDTDVHMRGGGDEDMAFDEEFFDPSQFDEQLLNEDEMSRIIDIEDEKAKAKATMQLYRAKAELLNSIKEKNTLLHAAINSIEKRNLMCGFDTILALNDAELASFLSLQPNNTLAAPEVDAAKLASNDKLLGPYERPGSLDGWHSTCIRKKCVKHGEWNKIFKEDTRYQAFLANRMVEKLENEEREIRSVAQVRAMVDEE